MTYSFRTPEQEQQLQIDLANAQARASVNRKNKQLEDRRGFTANMVELENKKTLRKKKFEEALGKPQGKRYKDIEELYTFLESEYTSEGPEDTVDIVSLDNLRPQLNSTINDLIPTTAPSIFSPTGFRRYENVSFPDAMSFAGENARALISNQAIAELEFEEFIWEQGVSERIKKFRSWEKTSREITSSTKKGNPFDMSLVFADMVLSSIVDDPREFTEEELRAEIETNPVTYSELNLLFNKKIMGSDLLDRSTTFRTAKDSTSVLAAVVLKEFAEKQKDQRLEEISFGQPSRSEDVFGGRDYDPKTGMFYGMNSWVWSGEDNFFKTSIADFERRQDTFRRNMSQVAIDGMIEEEMFLETLETNYKRAKEFIAGTARRVATVFEDSNKKQKARELSRVMQGNLFEIATDAATIKPGETGPEVQLKLGSIEATFDFLIEQEKSGVQTKEEHPKVYELFEKEGILAASEENLTLIERLERSKKFFVDNVVFKFNRMMETMTTPEGRYKVTMINQFKEFVDPSINTFQGVMKKVYTAIYDSDPNLNYYEKIKIMKLYSTGRSAFKKMSSVDENRSAMEKRILEITSPPTGTPPASSVTPLSVFERATKVELGDPARAAEFRLGIITDYKNRMIKNFVNRSGVTENQAVAAINNAVKIDTTGGVPTAYIDYDAVSPLELPSIVEVILNEMETYNVVGIPPILAGLGQQVREGLAIFGTEIDVNTEEGKAAALKGFRTVTALHILFGESGQLREDVVKQILGVSDQKYKGIRNVMAIIKSIHGDTAFGDLSNFYNLQDENQQLVTSERFQIEFQSIARQMLAGLAYAGSDFNLVDGQVSSAIQDLANGSAFLGLGTGLDEESALTDSINKTVGNTGRTIRQNIRRKMQMVFGLPEMATTEESEEVFRPIATRLGTILGLDVAAIEEANYEYINDSEYPMEDLTYILFRELTSNGHVQQKLANYMSARMSVRTAIPLSIEETLAMAETFATQYGEITPSTVMQTGDSSARLVFASNSMDSDFLRKLNNVEIPSTSYSQNKTSVAITEKLKRSKPKYSSASTLPHLEETFLIQTDSHENGFKIRMAQDWGMDQERYNDIMQEAIERAKENKHASLPDFHFDVIYQALSLAEGQETAVDMEVRQKRGYSYGGLNLDIMGRKSLEEKYTVRVAPDIGQLAGMGYGSNFASQDISVEETRTREVVSFPKLMEAYKIFSPDLSTMSPMGQASQSHSVGFDLQAGTSSGKKAGFRISLPNITFKGDIIK